MKYVFPLVIALILSSCNSNEYTCLCIDRVQDSIYKEVGNYPIIADKRESASFECQQKNMKFSSGELFKDVRCNLKTIE